MSRKIETLSVAGAGTSVANAVHRMLPIIAMAVGLVGCVMPPDADYVLTPPDQAPQITLLAPAPYVGVYYQGPECDPQRYSVWALDPDPGDRLYWRAYVDYGTNWPQAFTSGDLDNAPTAQEIAVTIAGDDSRFGRLTGVPHMVEILVADRKFAPDDRPPRGRVLEDTKGIIVSTIWTVQYVDKGCGP